ncbi:MAG: 3-dehydroquinate synthase [Siphonobacter sp.]
MVQIAPISESLPSFLAAHSYSQVAVLVDEHTRRYCYPVIRKLLPKHVLIPIRSGEEQKQLETASQIWEALTVAEFDRHGLLIDLGGGVIGDMGGFCAATYKRGMDFIQIPTTLLSQVDASVGGKLGIDFQGFKNHIGVFRVPDAVLIDTIFLQTLPYRELRSGFAEVIKHSLIADAVKWQEIRQKEWEEQDWADLIAHSVAIKEKITKEDPTEKGIRKILNFGHTLGHAIETFFLSNPKKRLLHGEAIAAGMITEAYLSFRRGWLTESELEQIEEFLFITYGKVEIPEEASDTIIMLTAQDKKNRGKEIRFSLLTGIGSCGYDIPVTKKEMKEALSYYAVK